MTNRLKLLPFALVIAASGAAFAAQEAAKPGDPPNIPMGTQANEPGAQTTPSATQSQQPGTQATQPAAPASTQAPAGAAAQSSADSAAQMKSLDRDGDGHVTKTEANSMKGLADSFDMADKDKNGKLDAAEFSDAVTRIKKN